MKRFAAQWLVQDNQHWLRNRVVEQQDDLKISHVFDLTEMQVEPARTLFFDGIITVFPIKLPSENKSEFLSSLVALKDEKNISWLKNRLTQFNREIILQKEKAIKEILSECIFQPAEEAGFDAQLLEDKTQILVLWQNVDLVTLKVTERLNIRLLSFSL